MVVISSFIVTSTFCKEGLQHAMQQQPSVSLFMLRHIALRTSADTLCCCPVPPLSPGSSLVEGLLAIQRVVLQAADCKEVPSVQSVQLMEHDHCKIHPPKV